MVSPSASVEAPHLIVAPLAVTVPDATVGAPGSVGGWFGGGRVVNAARVSFQPLRPPFPSDACTCTSYEVLAASPQRGSVRLVVLPTECHGSDGSLYWEYCSS